MIEEIERDLWKYVADESVAHAIREVRLYTGRLAETDGIVFFDVPGLNSGLGKHLEESRSMLEDCDAVICIRSSLRPTLEAHEQKLVDFIREGEREVGVADKLFVFAGQSDLHASPEALEGDMKNIEAEWIRRASLPTEHIEFGAQAAYLILKGAAREDLIQRVGSSDAVKAKLTMLNRLPNASTDEVIRFTGIPGIKDKIKHYLNHGRIRILMKQCDDPIKRMMTAARKIHVSVGDRFPESPDELKRQQENDRNIMFQQWWHQRWLEIDANVNRYFQEHFDVDIRGQDIESVQRLRERYAQFVLEGLGGLASIKENRIKDIFDSTCMPVFDARDANEKWRKTLFENDITDFLHDLSDKLSVELLQDAQSFVCFMSEQLWGSD